jgi:SAM-dependent methyltransferase
MLLINATEKNLGVAKIRFSRGPGRGNEKLKRYFCKNLIMTGREWFKAWFDSPYYHKLYFGRDEREAQQFINRLLSHLAPRPGCRMLDVACGRGRHSKLLAAAGYDVTGIDLSHHSIDYARQFEHDGLHFYQHDMRLPFWINYFDYAFNFFTSFGYFATRREHDAAMRTIAQSLVPGGTLLIDYLNVHYAEEHLQAAEQKLVDQTTYDIRRWQDAHHFYKKVIVSDPDLEEPLEFTEKVCKFSPGDFTDMLSYQNMQVTEVFGNYELQPYHIRQSPRMIVLARKKESVLPKSGA